MILTSKALFSNSSQTLAWQESAIAEATAEMARALVHLSRQVLREQQQLLVDYRDLIATHGRFIDKDVLEELESQANFGAQFKSKGPEDEARKLCVAYNKYAEAVQTLYEQKINSNPFPEEQKILSEEEDYAQTLGVQIRDRVLAMRERGLFTAPS